MKTLEELVELYVDLLFEEPMLMTMMTRTPYEAFTSALEQDKSMKTPCEVFTTALQRKRIDEATFEEARKCFGGLWNK